MDNVEKMNWQSDKNELAIAEKINVQRRKNELAIG